MKTFGYFSCLIVAFFLLKCTNNIDDKNTDLNKNYLLIDSLKTSNLPLADSLSNLLVLSNINNGDSNLIKAYLLRFVVLTNLLKYSEAKIINTACKNLCIKLNNKSGKIICEYNYAVLELLVDNPEGAITKYTAVIPKLNQLKEFKKLTLAKANLGWAFFNNNQFDLAIKLTNQALEDANTYNFKNLFLDFYQRMGAIYSEKSNKSGQNKEFLDSATVYFYKCEKLLLSDTSKLNLAYFYLNFGGFYVNCNNNKEALIYFFKALKIQNELKLELDKGFTYCNIGLAYQKIKNYTLSEKYLLLTKQVAAENNSKELESSVSLNLAVLYKETGRYKEATTYYINYIDKYTKIVNETTLKANNEHYLQFDLNKKDLENITLEKKKLKLQKSNFQLITTFIGFLILIGGVYFFINQKRKRKAILFKIEKEKEKDEAILQTENAERKRIASDLHDSVGQKLIVVQMQLAANEVQNQVLNNLLNNCINEVRSISHDLVPYDLNKGLKIAILNLADQVNFTNSTTKIIVKIKELNAFNKRTELFCYRIIQEIVNNALKHANASTINLSLVEAKDVLYIYIVDNGVGISSETILNKGNGLQNIKNRIEQLNGSYELITSPNKGTKYNLKIPI